jgi:hypothetical protein
LGRNFDDDWISRSSCADGPKETDVDADAVPADADGPKEMGVPTTFFGRSCYADALGGGQVKIRKIPF